jgi:Sec-independent protein translocase protein TatA
MGFGEFATLLLVALVVFGPKDLPRYLRKAGQFAGQLRNWALDMRQKSGIDDVLRMEGIDKDIAEIRKLTRGEMTGILGTVKSAANTLNATIAPRPYTPPPSLPPPPPPVVVNREREYPRDGADSYGALPDTAVLDETLVSSPLADDPVYTLAGPRESTASLAPSAHPDRSPSPSIGTGS